MANQLRADVDLSFQVYREVMAELGGGLSALIICESYLIAFPCTSSSENRQWGETELRDREMLTPSSSFVRLLCSLPHSDHPTNHIVHRLFQISPFEQAQKMLETLSPYLFFVATNQIGNRTLSSIVRSISTTSVRLS
jgi:hypothetical protein